MPVTQYVRKDEYEKLMADNLCLRADLAASQAECERLRADAERLNALDGNLSIRMGWYVTRAPAGNIVVRSVIQPRGATSIRSAIDAALAGEVKP